MTDRELTEMVDDLERGYDGDAWHGPSLRAVLDGVTAEVAAARPVPGGHTIWEVVVHLAAWDHVVARRIEGRVAVEEPDGGNFPPVVDATPDGWDDALKQLEIGHEHLLEAVARLDPARLRQTVAGKGYSVAHMVRGVAQHMAYHAGQVAMLRKLADAKSEAG